MLVQLWNKCARIDDARPGNMETTSRARAFGGLWPAVVFIGALLAPAPASGQSAPDPAGASRAVEVTANFDRHRWIAANEPIELAIGGPVDPAGRIAVMIGDVDFTALFERTQKGLRYRPGAISLPPGERELVVYHVATDHAWQEVGRFGMKVLTRGGYERAEAKPAVDVANKGQLASRSVPGLPAAARDRFQDVSFNLGLDTATVRRGWTTTTRVNVVGVSYQPEALRFAQQSADAPYVDLAGYHVTTGNRFATVALGHVSFGSHRHLFNNFASRGALATVRFGSRIDIGLTALNGSPIVGWNNIAGLQQSRHRVAGATLGLELTPNPGRLRVEASVLNARLLPRSGFNEGSITDAETNRGVGVRVMATDARQRFRFDSGFARSRFGNPGDPLLSGGVALVPVRDETRSARYLDVSYAFLNDVAMGRHKTTLVAAYRHEMVQPLFGSLMSFVRADVLQHVAEITGNLGPIAVQAAGTWMHDNLDGIASILETRTRLQQVNVAVPFAMFSRTKTWLPIATYTIARMHQRGAGLPVNSDFQDSHVPDQVSTNHTAGIEFQQARWRAGYRFNHSLQDNRQVGRTLADLANLTNTVSVGIMPGPRADFSLDVAFEGAENREVQRNDVTRRVGLSGNWRLTSQTGVTAMVSTTFLRNNVDASESRATDVNLQFAQTIPFTKRPAGKPQAQVFVRFARQSAFALIALGTAPDERRLWTVNTGVTVSFF